MSTKGISIIICCYNSEKRITPTLLHLLKQKQLENINWEIILVDNNSSDQTVRVAFNMIEEQLSPNIDFNIVYENQAGLSYARKKGIEVSKYEYVLFCDDDNWLNEYYIFNSYQFLNDHSKYAVVGGNGVANCEIEPPNWFESFKSVYAIGCRKDGDVTNVYGAGMAVKKALLKEFNSQMPDRIGKTLSSGGDSEMCFFLRSEGYKIRQLCNNTFKHFIPKERLTSKYLLKMAEGRGKSKARLDILRAGNKPSKIGLGYRARVQIKNMLKAISSGDKFKITYNFIYNKSYWSAVIKFKRN